MVRTSADPEQVETTLQSIDLSLHQIASWLQFFALQSDGFKDKTIGERAVLLKSAGLNNKSIADILSISDGAVRAHISKQSSKSSKA